MHIITQYTNSSKFTAEDTIGGLLGRTDLHCKSPKSWRVLRSPWYEAYLPFVKPTPKRQSDKTGVFFQLSPFITALWFINNFPPPARRFDTYATLLLVHNKKRNLRRDINSWSETTHRKTLAKKSETIDRTALSSRSYCWPLYRAALFASFIVWRPEIRWLEGLRRHHWPPRWRDAKPLV